VKLALLAGALVLVCALAGLASASDTSSRRVMPFRGTIAVIGPAQAKRMTGVSWRPSCPVALRDLRVLTMTYRGFDGHAHTGTLVVHRDVARAVVGAFRELYSSGFPIRRMVPVDAYGGSDFRSIEADNTSAFNCRYVDGTTRWSEHAYGRAIDINPIENPYIGCGKVYDPRMAPYVDRSKRKKGMVTPAVVRAFRSIGWGWGGDWSGTKDYMHFSTNGH
jgi:hypothetical protein